MISAMPNMPMASATKLDAVRQFRDAEGEALLAGLHVGADQAERHAQRHHADRLHYRALREHGRDDEAQQHQREVSAGPKDSATWVSSGPEPATKIVATEPAKKEPSAEVASAAPARPLRAIL